MALIEFALVLPILALVLAGMLAFGLVFFYWLDANRLASEAARWAVVDRNPYDLDQAPPFNDRSLQEHILDSVPSGMRDELKVCLEFPGPPPVEIGDPVTVRVEKPFSFVPLLGIDTITIRASSTMRIERFDNGTGPPVAYNIAPDGNYDVGTCP